MDFVKRILVMATLCLQLFCVGETDDVARETALNDELIAAFARELTKEDLDTLLSDPTDDTNPGMQINDLLYLLKKVEPDMMITLVQDAGAGTTLKLINNVRKLGCTRTGTAGLSDCTLQNYHYLNVLSQLMIGMEEPKKLSTVLKQSNLDPSRNGDKDRFLMKLAYVVVSADQYVPDGEDPALAGENLKGALRMKELLSKTYDSRDIVYLLESFDDQNCPHAGGNCVDPATITWNKVANGTQMTGIKNTMEILNQVEQGSKLADLMNGRRSKGEQDSIADGLQAIFLREKMVKLIEGPASPRENRRDFYNTKLASIINKVENTNYMRELIYDLDYNSAEVQKMITLMDELRYNPANEYADLDVAAMLMDTITPVDNPNPYMANRLKYLIVNANDVKALTCASAVAALSDAADPCLNKGLLTLVAEFSIHDDAGNKDLKAGGRKMGAMMSQIPDARDLLYLINNASMKNLADLVNQLQISASTRAGGMMLQINGTDTFNPAQGNRNTASGLGKVVHIVEFSSNASALAVLINEIESMDLITGLINDITSMNHMTALVKGAIAADNVNYAALKEMATLMKNLPNDEKNRKSLRLLIENFAAPTEDADNIIPDKNQYLAGKLLMPANRDGLGGAAMAELLEHLQADDLSTGTDEQADAVTRLIVLLQNFQPAGLLSDPVFKDNSDTKNIEVYKGFSKLVVKGGDFKPDINASLSYTFPGLGGRYLAAVINNANDANKLELLMRDMQIAEAIATLGCADRVGDLDGDNIIDANQPDFKTPCQQIGAW